MDRTDCSTLSSGTYAQIFRRAPTALIVIAVDGLIMSDANAAYLAAVGMSAEQVLGRHVFDVFPSDPDDGTTFDLRSFFTRTIALRATQVASEIRYDIPDADGELDTRWWNVVEVPLFDDDGEVHSLLHFTEDVTDLVRARTELDIVEAAREAVAQQLAGLAEVALALSSATTVADVEAILFGRGLPVLGVGGGGVLTATEDGSWQITTSEALGPQAELILRRLPHDSDTPPAVCARTGQRILLPDRDEGLRTYPAMGPLYERTRRESWAFLPLTVNKEVLGCLAVSWITRHVVGTSELELLDGFAAQCAAALHRIRAAEAQHRAAQQVADIAEALQLALLTAPPEHHELQIATRYVSAIDATRVGGDWYDAFEQRDGTLMLAIGDVAGHDSAAAAVMAQMRTTLRVLAHTADSDPDCDTPAGILTTFEEVARDLGVDALATAILARVELVETGRRVVRWSNAGHPPPILLHTDGSTELLDRRADPLLGTSFTFERHDHLAELPDGSTLLLYTDGLIERRTSSLFDGIDDVRAALADLGRAPLDALCDLVVERLAPHVGEDDIAMLAVRARPLG